MFFVFYPLFICMKLFFYINFAGLVFRFYFRCVYSFLYRWVQLDSRFAVWEGFRGVQSFLSFLIIVWLFIGFGLGWDLVSAPDLSNAQVNATLASTFVCPTKFGFYCGLFRLEEHTSQIYLWFFF